MLTLEVELTAQPIDRQNPRLTPGFPRGQSSNVIAAPLSEKVIPRATRVGGSLSRAHQIDLPAGLCVAAS